MFSSLNIYAYPANICVPFTPNYHIISPLQTSTFLGLSGIIINQTFIVDVDWTINSPTQFINCLFKVAPGKKITISTSGFKSFSNCNFYNCSTEWAGIELGTNAIDFRMDRSKVENSVNGVNMNGKTSIELHINNTNFYNNYIGIKIENGTTFTADYIWGNEFHGDPGDWRHGNPTLTSLPGYGIYINGNPSTGFANLNCDIGYPESGVVGTLPPNKFYDLYFAGIYSSSHWGRIQGVTFQNFHAFPPGLFVSYGFYKGIGIMSSFSRLIIQNLIGSYSYPPIDFSYLDYGILNRYYASSYNYNIMRVTGANFQDIASWAIYNEPQAQGDFGATSCVVRQGLSSSLPFSTSTSAFNGFHVSGDMVFKLNDNYFYSNLTVGTTPLLHYQNFIDGSTSMGSLYGTIINNKYYNSIFGGVSTMVTNGEGIEVAENEYFPYIYSGTAPLVLWQLASLDAGVWAHNNEFDNDLARDGIHLSGDYGHYCENSIDKSIYGVHVIENNLTELAKTYFENADIALYLEKPSSLQPILGPQYHTENCWNNLSTYFEAYNEATTPLAISASQFDVVNTGCLLPSTIAPAGWFISSPPDKPNNCEERKTPFLVMQTEDFESMSWESKYKWYENLSSRTLLNSREIDFMTSIQATSIPVLNDLEKQIDNIIGGNSDNYFQIIELSEQIDIIKNQLLELGNIENPNEEELILIETLMSQLNVFQSQIGIIIEEMKLEDASQASTVLNILNSLSSNDQNETTYKDYLKLKVRVLLEGNSEESFSIASEIASRDYATNGHGVKKAIHYQSWQNKELDYWNMGQVCMADHNDDISNPDLERDFKITSSKDWNLDKIGRNTFNLSYNQDFETKFELFSIQGIKVGTGKINPGLNTLEFSQIPFGYYILKCENSGKIVKILIE